MTTEDKVSYVLHDRKQAGPNGFKLSLQEVDVRRSSLLHPTTSRNHSDRRTAPAARSVAIAQGCTVNHPDLITVVPGNLRVNPFLKLLHSTLIAFVGGWPGPHVVESHCDHAGTASRC